MPSARLLALLAVAALVGGADVARADEPTDGGVSDAAPNSALDGGEALDDIEIEKPRPKWKPAVEESTATPAPAPVCKIDNDCPLGTICDDGQCIPVRKRGKFIPPFYFSNPSHHGGYRIAAPFYIQAWKHDGEHDWDNKVVPLLLSWQHTDKSGKSTRIFPFIWHKTYTDHQGNKTGTQIGVMPIFWWQRNSGHDYGAIPFFLSGWQHDPKRDFTEVMGGLLGYYQREKDKIWRVGFPLYWDRQTKDSRFATVLPLVYYHRDGPASQTIGFPLFWRFHNAATHNDNTLFFPLFDYARLKGGRRTLFLSLLAGWEHDRDDERTQGFVLPALFYHRRDRDLDLDVQLPLFARWHSRLTGTRGMVIGPYGTVSDSTGSTTALFPFWWRVEDKRTHAQTHFFLVGGYQQRPGFRVGAVGPAFGWRREHDGKTTGFGGGLAPVLFFGRSETSAHAALLPLFWWSKDRATGKQLTAVGPVYVRQDPTVHGVDVGLLPLLHFGHEDQRTYAYVAPVFWFRKNPERTTVVFGPAYGSKAKNGDYDAGLAPLAFFHKHGQDRAQVVLPLFYRVAHGNDSTTAVLPFVHDHRGDTTTDVLFPLAFAQRKPGVLTVGTLLGGYHRDGDHAVGVFGPYIYRKNANSSTHVLFPLAFVHRSQQMDLTAVFPLVWDVRTGKEHDSLVVPFYYRRRGGYTNVDALLPVFVHTKNAYASTWVVGPVFARKVNNGWTQAGMLGVFSYGQKREGDKVSRFLGGPGFYYAHNDFAGTQKLLVGPFFDTRRPDGYTSGLFPLAFAWRRGNASYAIAPFFYRHTDRATNFALTVLGPLYFGHKDKQVRFGLAPIFFGQYGGDESKTVLFPVLYFGKRKDGSTLVTPLGGYKSYEGGFTSVVGPVYVRRDKLQSSTWIFPIIYHGVNKLTQSSTTVAFPLYLDHRDQIEGTRIQAFTPLVWRWRSVERTFTLGFPLVFDEKVHGESRTTGVLPFFIRHRSEVSKSTWWTVPALLTWARTRTEDDGTKSHDFVFFPLVWRFGGKERSSTVAFPIYWDFRRGENRTQVIFPIMARWTRPDGDRLVVLNTYYRKGKGPREGSWSLNVVPFFDIGHPRAHDFEWNVLEGFIGYSRLGRNRTLKLLWFIPIPLEPAPASSLTWWSNTPPDKRVEF